MFFNVIKIKIKIKIKLTWTKEISKEGGRKEMKPTVVTITGIRPDFIRMSEVFKQFDLHFNHLLVVTGQHYSHLLASVFFEELNIRQPNFVLEAGTTGGGKHYHQLAYLSTAIIELFEKNEIKPDLIFFLGDSNSVCASLPLKKEGYRIAHIEAGMRSFDRRMLEEINRTTCDHCSDLLFVYHDEYKRFLQNENIHDNVYVVGNTIREVCMPFVEEQKTLPKPRDIILVDIHRPENFNYPRRMQRILDYANKCSKRFGLPVQMLKFHGTCRSIQTYSLDLGEIELVELMSYKTYLDTIGRKCKFLISDSGTGQEEPALFQTPVIVPREYTERPQSAAANCSFMLSLKEEEEEESESEKEKEEESSFEYLNGIWNGRLTMSTEWLGDGHTAERIREETSRFLNKSK